MEYPPLWVWAIIVGIIIATKLVLRWQATKHTVNDASDRYISNNEKKDSTLDSLDRNTSTSMVCFACTEAVLIHGKNDYERPPKIGATDMSPVLLVLPRW